MKLSRDPVSDESTPATDNCLLTHWLQEQGHTTTTAFHMFLSILDSIGDGVIVIENGGQPVHLNQAARTILNDQAIGLLTGQHAGQVLCYLPDMVTPYPSAQLPLARALQGEHTDADEVYMAQPGAVSGTWLSVTARPLRDEHGILRGGVAIFRDISAAKQAETALRESEERYALAARGANDGLWDWDITQNQIYLSPRWKTMLGFDETTIGNNPDEWFSRVHPDDRERVQLHLMAHFKGLITHFENEHRMLHRDGTYRWMLCRGLAVRNDSGQTTRMAGSQTDITNRKQAEEQLAHGALHDALTGLPNRALFLDRLERTLTRIGQDNDNLFAVLCLDLDRFKVINDSLGHLIGDQLLIAFARRVTELLRAEDTLARLGGDEFAILLEHIDSVDDTIHLAEQIQHELMQPFYLHNHEVFTTVSIGIAPSNAGYTHPEDMLRDADTAMYQAKAGGKACHVIFDMTMHTHALALLRLEADMRRALEHEEFRIHYQPIVSLQTGQITGFEALLRWTHPSLGAISPAEFIPVAEETGLIVPLGLWVLREACRQMRTWQQQFPSNPPLSISVNISSKQFAQFDLVAQVARILAETGLDPASLNLEITESMIMEHGKNTTSMLWELRNLGVHLSIDDFGTGYSSLSYLQHFPITMLKIDRSFISGIGKDRESINIIHTILTLARMLGITTVAEGTETAEQVNRLQSLHCDYVQGWWICGAVDSTMAETLLMDSAQNHQANAVTHRLHYIRSLKTRTLTPDATAGPSIQL